MAVDRARIEKAKTFVQRDERGYYTSTKFDRVFSLARLTLALEGSAADPKVDKALARLRFIDQDLRNLLTLYAKSAWLTEQHLAGVLDDAQASLFVAADIDMFHVEFRSLFDYLAAFVRIISLAPGEVSANNFGTLLGLLRAPDKPRVRPSLGNDLAALVDGCDWFEKLQNVRDKGVHQGGFTLVYPAQDELRDALFQTYEGGIGDALVDLPEVMFNQNVVNFALYASLHVGYLVVLLDEIAAIAESRLPLKPVATEPRSYHTAWPQIVARWGRLTVDN